MCNSQYVTLSYVVPRFAIGLVLQQDSDLNNNQNLLNVYQTNNNNLLLSHLKFGDNPYS